MTYRILLCVRDVGGANTGGTQRTQLMLESLGRLGSVDLAIPGPRPEHLGAIAQEVHHFHRAAGETSVIVRWLGSIFRVSPERISHNLFPRHRRDPVASAELKGLVETGNYDVVVCRDYTLAVELGLSELRVPLIVDVDDIGSVHAASLVTARASTLRRRFQGLWLWLWCRAWEIVFCPTFRFGFFVAREDFDRVPVEERAWLPNSPYWPTVRPLDPPRRMLQLLFVGSMRHGPNARALDSFLQWEWPQIRDRIPEVGLTVVGNHMTEAQQSRWGTFEGVTVLGHVKELSDAYREAALSIVPIEEGAGSKIKVLESLGFGRPVVATPYASRGFGGSLPGLRIARRGNEFTEAVIETLSLKSGDGLVYSAAVSERFSASRLREVVGDMVKRAFGQVPEPRPKRLSGR